MPSALPVQGSDRLSGVRSAPRRTVGLSAFTSAGSKQGRRGTVASGNPYWVTRDRFAPGNLTTKSGRPHRIMQLQPKRANQADICAPGVDPAPVTVRDSFWTQRNAGSPIRDSYSWIGI